MGGGKRKPPEWYFFGKVVKNSHGLEEITNLRLGGGHAALGKTVPAAAPAVESGV